jgi:molybdopterin-biosynthesis enzyme MoeA-like protein
MKIGLYIIGDEILSGRRRDAHLPTVIELLKQRQLSLSWAQIIGDDFDALSAAFRRSLVGDALVLCTGGIGGTPDDITRQAIAAAAGVELEPHPEGLVILKEKFGDELTPIRQRMIEFPKGAELIPNPVNQIPGFSFQRHYCVPGFPQMVLPMIEWVLDRWPGSPAGEPVVEAVVRIRDVAESRLIPLMENLLQAYPGLKVFSLPSIAPENRYVELGARGTAVMVDAAMRDIEQELNTGKLDWEKI